MTHVRAACIQMRSAAEIAPNIAAASDLITAAAEAGATLFSPPGMTKIPALLPRPRLGEGRVGEEG